MRLIKIKNIGKVVSGSTPKTDVDEFWNGEIPWVTPKEISILNTPFLNETERRITETGFKSTSTTMLPKGSILFTSRAPIGLVAITNIEVCTNQGFKSLVLNPGFSPLYIYYILKFNSNKLDRLGTGTTFRELSKATLENFELPVPELNEQIRIATVLYKTETILMQRNDTVQLLDDFLKSTFMRMFEPFFKTKYFKKLLSLCTKITDGTHDTPERLKEGVKFITGKHIKPFIIDFNNSDYVKEEVHREIYNRCNPEFGDILYTNIGVNLGTAAMNNVNYEFSMKNVALLKPRRELIEPRYLEHILNLNSRRNRILTVNSSGGAQQFLSLNQIKNIDIPLPPIELQKEFTSIVEKAEMIKGQFAENLVQVENLFGSLRQRAFKGNLDLTSINVQNSEEYLQGTEVHKPDIGIENKPKSTKEKSQQKSKNTLRKKATEKITWDKVSSQQVAEWIKERYEGYHFSNEMLIRFLMDEYVVLPDYYSSEELKKYPQLNGADDIKSFIFSAVSNDNPFIKLEQHFYNAEKETFHLNVTTEDYELIGSREAKERSGIYFSIVEK
jgi:restriction endonuclease S subunit